MTRYHRSLMLVLLGVFALPFAAGAEDKRDAEGNINWSDHPPSQGPFKSAVRGMHLGTAASVDAAERRIVITPGARYANVTRGEVVTFAYGDKAFAWKFDTLGTPNMALAEIAPRDFGSGHVRIYVAPDPLELSGG